MLLLDGGLFRRCLAQMGLALGLIDRLLGILAGLPGLQSELTGKAGLRAIVRQAAWIASLGGVVQLRLQISLTRSVHLVGVSDT